ncbi:MAG: hypothetical protein U0Z44_06735 [Kouleothrix sp.]
MRLHVPLAALYAAGILRAGLLGGPARRHAIDGEAEFEAALARHQPRYAVLYEDNFNFLSKSSRRAHARRGLHHERDGGRARRHGDRYRRRCQRSPRALPGPRRARRDGLRRGRPHAGRLLAALEAAAPHAAISGIAGLALADPRAPGGCTAAPGVAPSATPTCFPSRPGISSMSSATARPGSRPTASIA